MKEVTEKLRLIETYTCFVTGLVFVKIPSPVGLRYKLREMDKVGEVGPNFWMATTTFCPIHVPASLTNLTQWKVWDDDRKPFTNMSWNDLNDKKTGFITRLNALTGMNYRLPTEHEWEWAAFGGEDFDYAGCTNWKKTSVLERGWDDGPMTTGPGNIRLANGYGLHDMVGNVWEWTSSDWDSYRVIRGVCWRFDGRYASACYQRAGRKEHMSEDDLGFRLCFLAPQRRRVRVPISR